jgi:hypothetical protein
MITVVTNQSVVKDTWCIARKILSDNVSLQWTQL